ncbi:MAG: 4-(cytidine 5'-diphospho)-2-C-methyl-D-erythritol kinase [Bacteroidota bacterium]
MIVFPHAKINLGLHILSKREDGFHNLATLFYPIPLTDILEFVPSDHAEFTQSGITVNCPVEENLIWKAYQILKNSFDLPSLRIHLHKIIPLGAGLGGGSSDASFMLKTLNTYFSLNLTQEELSRIALQLGSDCPFFLQDNPSFAQGKGELLQPFNPVLSGYHLTLVYPSFSVSTKDAYAGIIPGEYRPSLRKIVQRPVKEWKNSLFNDFEKPVFKKYPALKEIKSELYRLGADYSAMSGSGSTIFGLSRHPLNIQGLFPESFIFQKPLP